MPQIMTWQTWARRHNPKRVYCPDGVKPFYTSIGPTLLDYGFRPIGEIMAARPSEGPWREQVRREVDEMRGGYFDVDNMEIVYWVSYPSPGYYHINVYIYGRPKNTKEG